MNKINPPIFDKKTLRMIVQEKIAHMSDEKKKKESEIVCIKLIEILTKKDFETLITYVAFDDEIDVFKINKQIEGMWKTLLVIPQSNEEFIVPKNSILIIPWRAFTKEWKRIGRGSGYYDVLLTKYPNTPTIGICFMCQVLTDMPEDSWDKRVDEVVFAGNILE
jgi:5-formyltetrahydrofolate cyclo-ligase